MLRSVTGRPNEQPSLRQCLSSTLALTWKENTATRISQAVAWVWGGVLSDRWISHQKLWSVHDVRKPWSVSLPLSNHPKLGELSIQAPHRWGDTQQEQPPPSFGRILLHQSRQVAPGLTCLWKLKLSHRKTLNNPLGLKRWLFQWDLSFFISFFNPYVMWYYMYF